ncbi:collagen binding domain-containing protein [Paenibacillus lutrae]|uniref:LPXTG cell wall anchor domain-containing protein n=1 Tax=Paenibacillus lutrae TaxID=2078573 RepID=A0A7X3FJV3_9BACL|nr:collagen binding domain-containing protein [Paenibacillus lutrae]MVP00990.1 LPXTG cell wall anchor domain-containing protein [Paenibacillus lutrae]
MLRKWGKLPYVFMAVILLLNLLAPSSFALANGVSGGTGGESVTTGVYGTGGDSTVNGSVYGDPNAKGLAASGPVIQQNIITGISMKDKDGNKIEDVRLDQGARVQVDVYWTLPDNHGYSNGSSFTFDLPDNFKVDRPLTGELEGDVGTYEVTPEGQVTFVFSEEIENNQKWTGNFYVWREFEESKFSGGTNQEIIFQFPGEQIVIPVYFKSKSTKEMNKTGSPDKGRNPGKITWTADINLGEKKIQNAVFKDMLKGDANLDMDMNSIEVYALEVQLDGKLVQKQKLDPNNDYTSTPNAGGFVLNLGDISSAYRVVYTTGITSTADKTYVNEAELSGTGLSSPLPATASVPVQFSKPLTKNSPAYDSASQTITWAVQYNYNEQTIAANDAWIDDIIETNQQELIPSSFEVYEMTIDSGGNAAQKTGTPLTENTQYTVTPTATGFKLTFTDAVDSAYEIKYKTKAVDRVHADKVTVTNKVSMPGVPEIKAYRDINQVIFWKSYGKIDYALKIMDWKISLNDDEKQMSDVYILDDYAGQGMTMLPDTLEISGLTKDTDYKIEADPDYTEGFKITFLKDITTKHMITYSTQFDPANNKKTQYTNNAHLNWVEGGVQQIAISKTVDRPLDNYTKDNGSKTGKYDAVTKDINWTLDINYNLHKIDQGVVRDFYTGEQTFKPGSVSVQALKLTGADNGVTPTGALLVLNQDYKIETKTLNGKDGFELTFLKPIDSAYRIKYTTSLENHPVAAVYSNEAVLIDASQPAKELYKKTATVKPKFGGEYINKTGRQGTGASQEYAYWQVNVNRSQSVVENAVLKDTLSANQILLPGSFKLYHTRVVADGTLAKTGPVNETEYTLNVQANSFTLTFKNTLHEAYILEYESFINADNGESISNNATLAGQSSGSVQENGHGNFVAKFSGAGGGAQTPGKGNLKVIKVDAVTKAPLQGARFALYDKSGATLLQELVTDASGEALFENYKYKEYMLKEVSAPAGYLISDEYRVGKKLTFTQTAAEVTVNNTKGVWDVELTKVEQGVQGNKLEGAVFKLQMLSNGSYADVPGKSALVTDSSGTLMLSHLDPGSYQFVETTAPKGFKLSTVPVTFTIEANQSAPKKVTAVNERYIGSAELVKTDEYNKAPLEGAEFELRDEQGNMLKTGLKTDSSGKLLVNGLKSGSYQLVEVQAPAGYVLKLDPLKFDIADDQQVGLTFTNSRITGSVKLTKIETGRPDQKLKDAQFRILDHDKKPVKDSGGLDITGLLTDANGEWTVSGLRPGRYYAEETAAPAGYTIQNALTEFEIVEGLETTVVVENSRIVSGGGGGGGGSVDPNPPVTPQPPVTPDPDPETPVTPNPKPEPPATPDPKPDQPGGGEPSDPGTDGPADPTVPVQPEVPGESGTPDTGGTDDGAQPGGSNPPATGGAGESGGSDSSEGGSGGLVKDTNDSDGGSADSSQGGSVKGSAADVLPQTGEASSLPIQLAGLGLMVLGAVLYLLRRKHGSKHGV